MKRILVKWVKSDADYNRIYGGKEMRVVESTHPRFSAGTRFDWGFCTIATSEEGYTVEIQPGELS